MPVVVIIIIALLTVANSWHVLHEAIANPPNHLFTGIAHYAGDYFLYISQIAQGGHTPSLFAQHQFTNETLAPTWIYWFNVLLGTLHINPFLTYTLALLFLVVSLLTLIWYITKAALPTRQAQIIAFIGITTASNFFDVSRFLHAGTFTMVGDFWFSPTPALNRLGGVPHQVFQTILILLVITVCIHFIEAKRKSGWVYMLVAGIAFLAASANPIQMVLATITISGIVLIRIYTKHARRHDVILALLVLIGAFIGALLTNAEFARQPILTAAKAWENNQHVSVSVMQFFWAVGPIALLIPFGIAALRKKHTRMLSAYTLYSVVSLLFFFSPIPTLLGTTQVRWLSPTVFMGLGFLATLGLYEISVWTKKHIHIATPFFYGACMAFYILCTVPSIIAQVDARTLPLITDPTLMALNHLSPGVVDGLIRLQNEPKYGVVMTDPSLPYDLVVPGMTGHTTFTGHPIHTLYPPIKEQLRTQFFSGSMTPDIAQQFLNDHRITYIISAPFHTSIFARYPFLTAIFSNTTLVIYKK